jgi:DNA replication and repair protein RecF
MEFPINGLGNQAKLSNLKVRQLRNLASIEFQASPTINVFHGDNGQGKTNMLEGIAIASGLRPLRSVQRYRDLVMNGQQEAHLHALFTGNDSFTVDLSLGLKGKQLQLSGKPLKDSAQLMERLATVSFVPDDMNMVMGSGSFRRRALDQLAFGLFPAHVSICRRYERALSQRNALLKAEFFDRHVYASYTELLVEHATLLTDYRLRALQVFMPFFRQTLSSLNQNKFSIKLTYTHSLASDQDSKLTSDLEAFDVNEYQNQLKVALSKREFEERRRKVTVAGPHLDDLLIDLNDASAQKTASRGQARTMVLAFKIAHLLAVVAERKLTPLLLLDDVMSELDPHHAQSLMHTVAELGAQTFITTASLNTLPLPADIKPACFEIRAGAIF